MRAVAIIAAALLSGHHQVVQTTPGRAILVTQLACPVNEPRNYHLRCVDGVLDVTRLHYSTGNHVAELPVAFRRLTVINRFGRLAGWVDWRRRSGNAQHLAVGSMLRTGVEEAWQFS